MIDFDTAFDRLIGSEGGYGAVVEDSGNWTGGFVGRGELKGTKFGISAAAYPYLDIKNLTLSQAKEIYFRDFWAILGEAHPSVKFQLFDSAVNHGYPNAIRMLQRAVRVAPDGQWGQISQAALNSMDTNDLLFRFIAYRLKYWASLKSFDTFGRGWMNRGADNLLYAAEDNG